MSLQLTEHLSKALLAPFGVPIGAYRLAFSPAEARDAAAYGTPVAVKGQVPAGSRGRSGAVLRANTAAAAARAFTSVTAVEVDDLRAVQALVEPWHDITQELYLAVTFDTQRQAPVLLFSAVGGVDVESHADHTPTLLLQLKPSFRLQASSRSLRMRRSTSWRGNRWRRWHATSRRRSLNSRRTPWN